MASPTPNPELVAHVQTAFQQAQQAGGAFQWLVTTNYIGGTNSTAIVTFNAGTLVLVYEYQSVPAASIYLWHQGGTTTPINPGVNNIPVNPGDFIVYSLANPTQDSIKLQYGLV